jgi:hypothetical protein
MATMTEIPDPSNKRLTSHEYHAEAQLLSGHLTHPYEIVIEPQAGLNFRGVRAGRLFQQVNQYSAEAMISFQSGFTGVSCGQSQQHGWMALSTSVLEGLNAFEVITAERVVAQVSTEHPDNKGRNPEYVPKVTFLGTRFENLRVGGYPVQFELDLGICGEKPEGDRPYLEDRRFLDRVQHQLESIARANDLPRHLGEEYDSKIAHIHDLSKRANRREKADPNEHPSLHCSLVKSIGPIPIPGARTIGNLILIPDFGIVSLADVEVGIQPDDDGSSANPPGRSPQELGHTNFFTLTMLKMRMGSIAEGTVEAASASLGGRTVTTGTGDLADRPSRASSNLPEEKPEGADGTSVTRYPKIDLTVEDRPQRQVLLTIDLALLPDPRTETSGVTVTAPEGWTELRIQTEITAPDLRFEPGQDSRTIVVHKNAPSEPYRVKAWMSGDLKEQDAIEVRATFYYEGRNCGSARRAFPISQVLQATPLRKAVTLDVEAATTVRALEGQLKAGKIADKLLSMELPKQSVIPESRREVPPIGYTAGSMEAPLGAKPPKLTVEIQSCFKEPGRQFWHLRVPDSVRDECTLPPDLTAEVDLKKDEPKYVADLFKVLDAIESGQHMTFFQGLGDRLYEITPACFQEVYWLLFDKYGSFPIQILSNDPYVPWELMRPTRPENDKRGPDPEILARRHPVGRWFLNKEGSMLIRLRAGKVATIAPDYSQSPPHKGLRPLLSAQAESKKICDKLGSNAVRITGRKDNVLELFVDAKKEDIGLVHYAGHGASNFENAEYAQLFLEDTDLRPLDIRRKETQLGRNRHSLVFFNACGAGAPGLNLGVIGGFAEALIEDRFGGFIAPLWSVYDVNASAVILDFLEHVLLQDGAQRQTFAAALQRIRNESGEESPTFLSYAYYGDVMAAFV